MSKCFRFFRLPFAFFGCIVVLVLAVPGTASAAGCGQGKIVTLHFGSWNSDDFMIKLDYSGWESSHPGTEFNGLIRYRADQLSPQRFMLLASAAMTAKANDLTVMAFSHNNDCSNATELQLK